MYGKFAWCTVLVHQHFSPYIFYGEYQTSEAYNFLTAAPFPFILEDCILQNLSYFQIILVAITTKSKFDDVT